MVLIAGSLADQPAKPRAAADLVGVYLGYTSDCDFYRLDLRSDFTGFCASVSPPSSSLHEYGVDTYRITKWSLKGWELSFALVPIGAKSGPIYLKGRVEAFDVLLEVGGTTNNWSRKAVLYSEEQMRVSNEETKAAIKRAEVK